MTDFVPKIDETGLYAQRPKSLKELYKILLDCGTRPQCIVDITEDLGDTSTEAPAGQTPDWFNPRELPCLVGTMISDIPPKYQAAFRKNNWYPFFDPIESPRSNPCIHSNGCHASDTTITWYMYIFCDDVPELMREWHDLHAPVVQSQEKCQKIRDLIEEAIEKATEEIRTKFDIKSAELAHSWEIKKVTEAKKQIIKEVQSKKRKRR